MISMKKVRGYIIIHIKYYMKEERIKYGNIFLF